MGRKKNYVQKWLFGLISLGLILPTYASFDKNLVGQHKIKFNQLAMDLWE